MSEASNKTHIMVIGAERAEGLGHPAEISDFDPKNPEHLEQYPLVAEYIAAIGALAVEGVTFRGHILRMQPGSRDALMTATEQLFRMVGASDKANDKTIVIAANQPATLDMKPEFTTTSPQRRPGLAGRLKDAFQGPVPGTMELKNDKLTAWAKGQEDVVFPVLETKLVLGDTVHAYVDHRPTTSQVAAPNSVSTEVERRINSTVLEEGMPVHDPALNELRVPRRGGKFDKSVTQAAQDVIRRHHSGPSSE